MFANNQLTKTEDLPAFDHDLLLSVGVKVAKHRLQILAEKNKEANKQRAEREKQLQADSAHEQQEIIERVTKLGLNEEYLLAWAKRNWPLCDRDLLISQGYMKSEQQGLPLQGLAVITSAHRSEKGNALLQEVKDLFWALLYGSSDTKVDLNRVERELWAITVAEHKAFAFGFLQAVTEVGVKGTWRDPDNVSTDIGASNMLLEVEYGEIKSELVGDALTVCTQLINLLEVNEQILYARSVNVEQSTLLTKLYFESK